MAYDYLTLCQQVAQDAGLSGSKMITVTGQTGDLARIVRYVANACVDIESLWTDWKFMWGGVATIPLIPGVAVYQAPPVLDLGLWDRDRMRIDGVPIPPCNVIPYDDEVLLSTDLTAEGYPFQVVIQPDNSLRFVSVPDQAYTFTCDFYRNPTILVKDTDIPRVPQQFCQIIVAKALLAYATYDAAAELAAKAQGEYTMWLDRLETRFRPGGEASGQSNGNHIQIIPE